MIKLTTQGEFDLWKQIFPEFSLDDHVFILPPVNILGDSYIALGFLSAFEAQRRKNVFIAASDEMSNHIKAIRLQAPPENKTKYLDQSAFRLVSEIYTNGPFISSLNIGEKRYFANNLASVVHPGFGSGAIKWMNKGIPVYDLFRIHLSLDCAAPFQSHRTHDYQHKAAAGLFAQWRLARDKTVVVFPDSNSIRWRNEEFIGAFAKKIKEHGYQVIFDTANPYYSAFGPVTQLDLEIIVPFMDLCGAALIVRSGMADLTLGSTARRAILYPNQATKTSFSIAEHGGKLLEIATDEADDCLRRMTEYLTG